MRLCVVFLALVVTGTCAQAQEFRMTCRGEKGVYLVVYDSVRNAFTNNNPQFKPPWKIKRTQVDEDGALIWTSVKVHYGERDALAFFGREKWIRYFYANGSVVEDICRN
jgi:hypothetical protein